MTSKFLTGGGGTANLSDGSIDIYAATLGSVNLSTSMPIKTNSVKQLVSTNLEISDINNLQNILDNIADTTLTTEGGDQDLVIDGTGPDLLIKGLTAGDDITLSSDGTSITINYDDTRLVAVEDKTQHIPVAHNPFIFTDSVPVNQNENRVYVDNDFNFYSGSFGDSGFPEPSVNPSAYYTGITYNVSNESEFDNALVSSLDTDIINITSSITLTGVKTISKKLKIQGTSTSIKLTFSSASTIMTITSDYVWFYNLSFNNPNTGSSAVILTFSGLSNTNNFITNCIFETNEFAISSNNTNIQITDNTFRFIGTPDSHRYIILTGGLGEVFIVNNIFEGNGGASTQCININNAIASNFLNGHLIIKNNISQLFPVQRLLMVDISLQNSNISLYVSSNTLTTTSGFLLFFVLPLDGVKQIYVYDNTEILGTGITGSKGLIGLDSPAASVISFNTKIYSSRNTVPTLRADYTDLTTPSSNQPRTIAYATARFTPIQTYDLIIPYITNLISNAEADARILTLENKTQNILSGVGGITTISGTVETSIISSTTIKTETITNELFSSSVELTTGAVNITSDAINFNSNSMLYTPYPNSVEAGSFIKTGGTNTQYLLADGSTLQQSAVSGNSNFYLYNSSTDLTPPPINGHIEYNNAIQKNATIVYISHITSDTTDIEVFFYSVNQLNDLYIQDKNDSANYIKYNITGTPTILASQYMSVPVVVLEFGGTGETSFGVNHAVLLSFFSNNLEIDTRLSSLEDKTINQTAVGGTTTFSGIGGIIADKFVITGGGTSVEFLKSDGSLDANTYLTTQTTLTSDGGVESLVIDGTGPELHIKGLTAGLGITLTGSTDYIEIANSYTPVTTTLDNSGLPGSQSLVAFGTGPALSVKGLREGIDINLTSDADEVTINYDDTRLLAVESKTQRQSANGTTTTFTGTGGVIADKFVKAGGLATQILKADGSIISGGTSGHFVRGDASLLVGGTSSQLVRGNATLLTGGTSTQFVKGDASFDSTTYVPLVNNLIYGGKKFSTLATGFFDGARTNQNVLVSVSGNVGSDANEAIVGSTYTLFAFGTINSVSAPSFTIDFLNGTYTFPTSTNLPGGGGLTYKLDVVMTVRTTTTLLLCGEWTVYAPTPIITILRNVVACNTTTSSTFALEYTSAGAGASSVFQATSVILTKTG